MAQVSQVREAGPQPARRPHPPRGPPNWPELPSPFLALRGRPGKFSCADRGGHLEPGHCGPRAPATSGRTRAEPRRPRPSPGPRSPSPRNASGSLGAISQSLQDSNPGFSGRLSDTPACRPRTAEQRTGPSGERGSGTQQGVHVQTWEVPGHLPSTDPEPHLGQKKGWPGLSRSRALARPSLLRPAGRPAGRPQKPVVCRCCLKLKAAGLTEGFPPCGPPCPYSMTYSMTATAWTEEPFHLDPKGLESPRFGNNF